MIWLAGQIALFIAAAGAIGLVGGWMIRARVKPSYPSGSPEAWAAELETELDATHSELQAAKRAAASVPTLKEDLEQCRARIVGLESTLSGAGATEARIASAHAEAATLDKEESVKKVLDRFSGELELVEDDLERINGIGPVLVGLLKDLNIRTFVQIAEFTPEDIALVSAALGSFPDRIMRDEWIEQARELGRIHLSA